MSQSFTYVDLERTISPARAGRYLRSTAHPQTGVVDQQRAVALYEFNTRLASSMWGTIADIEVCLRNTIASAINGLHSSTSPPSGQRWYDDPAWFSTGKWFTSETLRSIKTAKKRTSDPGPSGGPRPADGRVIAELSLGFWRYLLIARYEHSLWNPAIRREFPALRRLSGSGSRQLVHGNVEQLHYLRNRVAHHEPVYEPFTIPGHRLQLDPTVAMSNAIEMISWSNPLAASWIKSRSTFAAVDRNRP